MAALPDMQRNFGKTSSDKFMQWIVSSCPVVAQSKKEGTQSFRQLGLLTSRNGETDVTVLWIRFQVDTRELRVTLTIRLEVKPK
jgi:hypothetical protein